MIETRQRELVGGPRDGELRAWATGAKLEVVTHSGGKRVVHRYSKDGRYEGIHRELESSWWVAEDDGDG